MKRYDPAPFFARLARSSHSQRSFAEAMGVHYTTVSSWRHRGVAEAHVDAACGVLGLHPYEVWPEYLEDEIARAAERKRRADAEAKARWRANRSPEKRQAELDYLASYREQYRAQLNAERRARYRRNRQAEIDYAVAYKRRQREQAS